MSQAMLLFIVKLFTIVSIAMVQCILLGIRHESLTLLSDIFQSLLDSRVVYRKRPCFLNDA